MWTLSRFCSAPDRGADDTCESVGRRVWPADEKVTAEDIDDGFGASDHDFVTGGVGCADESRCCGRWGDDLRCVPSGSGIGVRVLDAVHCQG